MEYSRYKLIILAVLTEGIVLVAALLLAKYFGIAFFPLTKNLPRDILIGTLGALFPLAFFIFSLTKKAENIPLLGSLRRILITEVRAIFSNTRLPDIVIISALAGIAEEFLFRGIIQVKLGLIIASILFGLVHFVTPVYIILATFMGLYIGIFFNLFGGLLIPVLLHFIYDLGALIYLRYFVKTEPDFEV
jgi:membrane protease YdiL (CAAX protease family)